MVADRPGGGRRAPRHRRASEHAVRVQRDRCEPELERYLAARGIEQALIAPVRGETRLAGVMVLGDRFGATTSFTDEDLRLFEALATHAGLSLELDRLEREAQSDPLTGLANRTLFLRRVEESLARGERDGDRAVPRPRRLQGDQRPRRPRGRRRRAGRRRRPDRAVRAAGRRRRAHGRRRVRGAAGGRRRPSRRAGRRPHPRSAGRAGDRRRRGDVGALQRRHRDRGAPGRSTPSELLRHADVAMYRAKEAGKSQVRVWFPEMQPAGEGAATGRDELAAALEFGELVAHFQPIVALDGGGEVAMEALARWRHPRHGLLGAGVVPARRRPRPDGRGRPRDPRAGVRARRRRLPHGGPRESRRRSKRARSATCSSRPASSPRGSCSS